MYWFEVEWEKLPFEWEKLLCNAITLIETKSVDPASGKNRGQTVSLLFIFENSLWRKKKISASSALVITKKLNGKCRELVELNDFSLQVCWQFLCVAFKVSKSKAFPPRIWCSHGSELSS